MSYRELDAFADAWKTHLSEMCEGELSFGFAVEPSVSLLAALLGAWRLNAQVVLLNPKAPTDYLRRSLDTLVIRTLFCSESILKNLRDEFHPVATKVHELASQHVETCNDLGHEGNEATPLGGGVYVATSGSSGNPKYAALSLRNLYTNAWRANRRIPLTPGDRWLLSLPLFHVSGLGILMRSWIGGGAVALPEPTQSLTVALAHIRPTHISLVATQLQRLIKDPGALVFMRASKAVLLGEAQYRKH